MPSLSIVIPLDGSTIHQGEVIITNNSHVERSILPIRPLAGFVNRLLSCGIETAATPLVLSAGSIFTSWRTDRIGFMTRFDRITREIRTDYGNTRIANTFQCSIPARWWWTPYRLMDNNWLLDVDGTSLVVEAGPTALNPLEQHVGAWAYGNVDAGGKVCWGTDANRPTDRWTPLMLDNQFFFVPFNADLRASTRLLNQPTEIPTPAIQAEAMTLGDRSRTITIAALLQNEGRTHGYAI